MHLPKLCEFISCQVWPVQFLGWHHGQTDTTQLGSLAVGYELVVGCDNPRDRGADQRRPETTPGASAGALVRAKPIFEKQLGPRLQSMDMGEWGGGWGLVTIILAVLCKSLFQSRTGGVYICLDYPSYQDPQLLRRSDFHLQIFKNYPRRSWS